MAAKIYSYELTESDSILAADFMAKDYGRYMSVQLLKVLPRNADNLVFHGEPGNGRCVVDYTIPDFDCRAESMK